MKPENVKAVLLTVLETIQKRCNRPWYPLEGSDIPKEKLPKFDSTAWPAATTLVGKALGVKIPASLHIFGGRDGKLLTVDQTVDVVCAYLVKASSVAAE